MSVRFPWSASTGAVCAAFLSTFCPTLLLAQFSTIDVLPRNSLISDVVWDATRNRLYAAASEANGARHEIAIIDPGTAQIEGMIPVPESASRLAVSPDGKWLYAGFPSSGIVRRYRLADSSPDVEINLGRNAYGYVWRPTSIVALPGDAVMIAYTVPFQQDAVAVFDGAVPRRLCIENRGIATLWRRPSDGQLFASGSALLYWLDVDAAGVRTRWDVPERAFRYKASSHSFGRDAVVDSAGFVYDLARLAPEGRIPLPAAVSTLPFLVGETGEAIYVAYPSATAGGLPRTRLVRYSRARLLAEAELLAPQTQDPGLFRWGAGGIGLYSAGRLHLTAEASFVPLARTPLPTPEHDETGIVRIPIEATGLTWDERRRLLYASLPGRAGSIGNSVISIDPVSGAPGEPVFVGSEPAALAISGDASRLFVALQGKPQVARLNLESRTLEASYSMLDPDVPPDRKVFWEPRQLVLDPRDPEAVIVLRGEGYYSRSVAVFDRRGRRRDVIERDVFADVMRAGDVPNTLITFNASVNTFDMRRLRWDENGVRIDGELYPVIFSFQGTFEVQRGMIFSSEGTVWTSDTESLLGSFAAGGFPLPDADASRVVHVGRSWLDNGLWVHVFDLRTFCPISAATIPSLSGEVREAIWAGPSRVALRSEREVVIVSLQALHPWPEPEVKAEEPAPGIRKLTLPVTSLAATPQGKLLAATSSVFGAWGNSILRIDPASGAVEQVSFAGSEPTKLTVSGDGRSAYAYLAGEVRIGRVNLDSGKRDLHFATDRQGGSLQYYVWDLASPPGSASIAASYYDGAIALFDEGRPRKLFDANTDHFSNWAARYGLAFSGAGDMLYGYNQWITDFDFKRCRVTPDGLVPLSTSRGITSGFGTQIAWAGGLIYNAIGDIIDPERSRRVAQFVDPLLQQPDGYTTLGKYVVVDPAAGRAIFISGTQLLVFSTADYSLTARLQLPAFSGRALSLVRLGDDGLAFHTTKGEIYVLSISSVPVLATPVPSPQKPMPSTPGVRILDLAAGDLAWDASRGRLYATVPNSEGAIGESIVAIDPTTLAVERIADPGPNPTRLSLSPDGRRLYFGMGLVNNHANYTGSKIRRLDLTTGALTAPYAREPESFREYFSGLWDLLALDGPTDSVAVVPNFWGSGTVKIYDGDQPRPQAMSGMYSCTSIQRGATPDRLYCYEGYTSGLTFSRLQVGPQGVTVIETKGGDFIGYGGIGGAIVCDRGRVYATSGRVIDPEALTEVGRVPAQGPVAVDGERVYWLEDTPTEIGRQVLTAVLKVYDRETLRPLANKAIALAESGTAFPGRSSTASLTPCGGGRLAFRSGRQIYIIDPF